MIMRKWWGEKPSMLARYFGAVSEWRELTTKRANLATERLDAHWDEILHLHLRIDLLVEQLNETVDSPTQMCEEWAG